MQEHIISKYFRQPQHPISVTVIGCGGTGSQVLQGLARINAALVKLEHPGLNVIAYDPDDVTEANCARQLFAEQEIGMNKAVALVTRINRFFGTGWFGVPMEYNETVLTTNVYFTCTDTVASRLKFIEQSRKWDRNITGHEKQPYYWIDCGNGRNTGQVWLTALSFAGGQLKNAYELYGVPEEQPNEASCSLPEALEKQDLFINTFIAATACQTLWQLFRHVWIENQGNFINLEKGVNIRSVKCQTIKPESKAA